MKNIIETQNFYLRPFNEDDFDILFDIFTDKDVIKYSFKRNEDQVLRILNRYTQRYKDFGISKFAVFSKDAKEFVGGCGFNILYDPEKDRNPLPKTKMMDYFNGDLELGYWFYKKFWGKGYATELAKAVCDFAFDKFPELTRIVAVTDPENTTSQRVLEKIGFEYLQDIETKEYGMEKFYVLNRL